MVQAHTRFQLAFHVGDDVHHVRITLHQHFFREFNTTSLGNASHVIASQINEHQMFG